MSEDSQDQIKVEGPAGIGLTFKGQQLFPAILVILFSLVFAYLFFTHDAKDDARAAATIAALKGVQDATVKADATQRAMIYVLSLSQEDRQKLNILKPKEITDMQR